MTWAFNRHPRQRQRPELGNLQTLSAVRGAAEKPTIAADYEVYSDVEPVLRIADDGLTAVLELPAGAHLSLAGLKAMLTAANIHVGLEPGALLSATRASIEDRALVVAHGRAPVNGADGRVELLVHEPTTVYGEGTVDLHELHHFREISHGTPVARLLPPGPGEPGCDVCGNPLPAKAGRAVEFGALLGPGSVIDDNDPSLARAAESGIYQRFTRGGKNFVQIMKEVTVPGDVDMTIGNISSHYPVVVQGDVHATFSLKSQKEIVIKGSVEDARISARGDLTVLGGILQGTTRVKAHGDIHARHIESREVKARNVLVDFAIHFAQVRATGTVVAKEIIGGDVLAAGSVTCDTLGDPDGRPTVVQVGVDPFSEALLTWAHQRGDHLGAEMLAVRERCRLLAHRVQTQLSAGDDHLSEDHALRHALAELADLKLTVERCQRIVAAHPDQAAHASMLVSAARIVVKRLINPGVILRIGAGVELAITLPRLGATFYRAENKIWELKS